MDSIEPPSFSLGFDLDAESDPNPGSILRDDEPELEPGLTVSDSDLELEPDSSIPVLKRLRRGINSVNKSCTEDDDANVLLGRTDDDDDIEEFSSPEDVPASTRSHFSSCSSRVSLRGSGVFTKQPSSISRSVEKRKRLDDIQASTAFASGSGSGSGVFTNQPSSSISRSQEERKRLDDVPASTGSGSGISSVAPLFHRPTHSPLRSFQLIDSDSEDDNNPSKRRVTETNDSSSKRKEPCTGDLLKDFPPVGVSKTQTAAQRRFQLLDSDSEDDHPSTTRDFSRGVASNSNDLSSKGKEPVSMPTCSPLRMFQLIDSDSEDDHPSTTRDLSRGVANDTNDLSSKRKERVSMPTCSPLRRFQLLDSDSEDDYLSTRRDLSKRNDTCSKDQPSVASKPKRKELGDLWKDFSPSAVSKIQTPALDDLCQDYFSSIKMSTSTTAQRQTSAAVASSSNSGLFQKNGQFLDSSHPAPPSHRFFLHSDPRIQNLARKRLPNFLPLGILNDKENRPEECLIDYMNQFGGDGSSKTGESSSKRGQTKSKGQGSSKARSSVPKDAGKRRVSAANSGSAGHWFTSSEGRKVYISKSGQEFSGQSAYRCYKKETGGGFKKSRKKRQPKKKAKK